MKKNACITVLNKDHKEQAKKLSQVLSEYGLEFAGHFWEDNLQQMSWSMAQTELVKKEVALWIILGNKAMLESESIRYGLAMLALGVQAQRGHGFPIAVVVDESDWQPASLPTALQGASVFALNNASLGPKLTVMANKPAPAVKTDYRLDIYAVPGIGQWLEIGPPKGEVWKGALFAVSDGDIRAHGVGPAGKLPQKTVLEYAMQGLKINQGEKEFTAWAVKNSIDSDNSYYVGIFGNPAAILFGQFPETDEAELFKLNLK
jgi:hypothetical protein